MHLVVLIKEITDKRTVYRASVGSYPCIGSNNDSAGRRTDFSGIVAKIPDDICTALVIGSAVDISKVKVIPREIRGINVNNNAYIIIIGQHIYEISLIILIVCDVVGVRIDDKRLARFNITVLNSLICVCERSIEIRCFVCPADIIDKLCAFISYAVKSTLNVILALVLIRIAYSHVGRLHIQQLIMSTVGVKAYSVAVVGICTLKAESENHLYLCVRRNIRHVKPIGIGRGSAEINHICTAADRTMTDNVAVLEIELIDTLDCGIALKVI